MGSYPVYKECYVCRHDDINHETRLPSKDNAPCLMRDCDCVNFVDKPQVQVEPIIGTFAPPPRPTGMTNAQAALIAAAHSLPGASVNEIRFMAAEFARILDNVDQQKQYGGFGI